MKPSFQPLLLGLFCIFSFFLNIGLYEVDIMEARNFVTAREMITDNHWIIPTMNENVRLEKPPLPVWITTISAIIGGLDSIVAMRFPAAVVASLMVFFFFLFVRELNDRDKSRLPFIAALILASMPLIIQMGRTNSWDIYGQAFMMGAMWLIHKGWFKEGASWKEFIWAGVLLGLSFMSKGPVSIYGLFLPYAVALGITSGTGQFKKKWREMVVAAIICSLISVPWRTYIYFVLPDVSSAIAEKEIVARIERHKRNHFFYLPFVIQTGVWCLLLVSSFFPKFAKLRMPKKNYQFALIWMLLSVVLLSLFPTKKERYLLPVMIPAALLIGELIIGIIDRMRHGEANRWDRLVSSLQFIIPAIALIATPLLLVYVSSYIQPMSLISLISYSFLFCSLGVFLLTFTIRKKIELAMYTLLTAIALSLAFLLPYTPELIYQNPSYKSADQCMQNEHTNGLTFYGVKEPDPRMVWKAGQPIRVLERKDLTHPDYLPMVLCGDYPAGELIPKSDLHKVEVTHEMECDNFREKSDWRWYTAVIYPSEK